LFKINKNERKRTVVKTYKSLKVKDNNAEDDQTDKYQVLARNSEETSDKRYFSLVTFVILKRSSAFTRNR